MNNHHDPLVEQVLSDARSIIQAMYDDDITAITVKVRKAGPLQRFKSRRAIPRRG